MRQMRMLWHVLAVSALMSGAAYSAWAQDSYGMTPPPAVPTVGSDQVDELMGKYNLHPAFQKGGRGLSNIFGGFMEIPLNVQKYYSTSDTAGSMFTGAAVGVVKAVVRTAVGFYETITFFLPYPENYAPILPTLEYYRKDTKRQPLPLE